MKKYLTLIMGVACLCLQACQTTPLVTDTPIPAPSFPPTFEAAKYGGADLDVTYCTQEGLPQKMDIYYPETGGPWPVVVYVHGGAWMEGDKAEGEGWRGLNDSGYLVVSINYRMAAEGKFPVMIEDVKCAVRYLRANRAEYNLDSARIGAIGASAGAHLVALLGTADEAAGWDEGEYAEQSSRVQAVVPLSGIYDFTIKVPSGIGTSIYYAFDFLAGKETPEIIAASPVSHIDAEDPPFLIIHGTQDPVLPFEQAELMQARLTGAGVPATLVVVENGDHSLNPSFGKDVSHTWAEINQIIFDFWEVNLK